MGYWNSRNFASLSIHLSIRKQVSDGNAMWTCSRSFSCYLRLGLFAIEGADAKNLCTRDTCTKNASFTITIYIKGVGSKDIGTKDACMESVCTGDIDWYY